MRKILLFLFLSVSIIPPLKAQRKLWYSEKKQFALDEDSSRVFAYLKDPTKREQFLADGKYSFEKMMNEHVISVFRDQSVPAIEFLEHMSADSNVMHCNIAYLFGNTPVIPRPEVLLQMKPGVKLDELLAKFNLTDKVRVISTAWPIIPESNIPKADRIKSEIPPMIKIAMSTALVFEVAALLYEGGMVEWCHPDMYIPIAHDDSPDYKKLNSKQPLMTAYKAMRRRALPNDPAFPNQQYLRNITYPKIDLEVDSLYYYENGTAPNVGIVDDGVEGHDDLNGTPIGYTPRTGGNGQPVTSTASHGMGCAGILGAITNNSDGITGVASGAAIRPVNIFVGGETLSDIATGLWYSYQSGSISVVSNSWNFDTYAPVGIDAIGSQLDAGRANGYIVNKGVVWVFSSGNTTTSNPSTIVRYPASYNGVMTVGAVQNNGTVEPYSCRGSSLDVVCVDEYPCPTLDRMGLSGATTNDYQAFNGTSAAAPQVAGVIAALRAMEDITINAVREDSIRYFITSACRDLGTAGFDNTYGWGLLNADSAVARFNSYKAYLDKGTSTATYRDFTLNIKDPFNTGFPLIPAGYQYIWTFSNGLATLSIPPYAPGSGTIPRSIRVTKAGTGSGTLTVKYGPVRGQWTTRSTTVTLGSMVSVVAGPNPALEYVKVKLSDDTNTSKPEELQIKQIRLFDLSGRQLITTPELADGTTVYDLRLDAVKLQFGQYILKIRTKAGEILDKQILIGKQ